MAFDGKRAEDIAAVAEEAKVEGEGIWTNSDGSETPKQKILNLKQHIISYEKQYAVNMDAAIADPTDSEALELAELATKKLAKLHEELTALEAAHANRVEEALK